MVNHKNFDLAFVDTYHWYITDDSELYSAYRWWWDGPYRFMDVLRFDWFRNSYIGNGATCFYTSLELKNAKEGMRRGRNYNLPLAR